MIAAGRALIGGSALRKNGVQTRKCSSRPLASGCYASASDVGRRQAMALVAAPALLLVASPAQALNFDRYIRGRKLPPMDSVLNPTLFCAEVLAKIDERLAAASAATFDAEDTRELLRLGPFTRFRDNLRTVAKVEGSDATAAIAEETLLSLNAFDEQLVAFKKAEEPEAKEAALSGARRELQQVREKLQRVIEPAQKKAAEEALAGPAGGSS